MSSLQTKKVDRKKTNHGMFQPILICGWRDVQNWEQSILEQNYNIIFVIQLKLSRYAEKDKHCIRYMLI